MFWKISRPTKTANKSSENVETSKLFGENSKKITSAKKFGLRRINA
jgi:hypothetical protein